MAEDGLDPYGHVPQQSRRDKLRIVAQNQPPILSGLLPLYDDPSLFSSDLLTCASGSHHELLHHPYFDMNHHNNQFLYSTTHGGGEVVVYKPEPLSLSLSNSHYTHQHRNNLLPLETAMIYSDKDVTATGYMVPSMNNNGGGGGGGASCSTSNEFTRCSVPLGPFTGYASILKGSRFLKPAQQMLEELCDVGKVIYAEEDSPMEPPPQNSSDDGGGCSESGRRKPRLISILDEVYRRYKQCYQQMQAVVASFECVAGLGDAAPYANLAMKAMSKQFRYLKNVINEQLQFTDHISPEKVESPRFERSYNRPVQSSGFLQNQPVWRPQRGLPERAVTVLRAWLFEHFLHPYPTDTDKVMLAKRTGLSRNQVSNWFINARVRIWKPMVEEIHMLDNRQTSQKEERNANKLSDHLSSAEHPSTSNQRVEGNNTTSKRTRSELPDVSIGSEPPNLLSYNDCFSIHPHAGGNAGVSLILGLHHQNNGIGLSQPFPMNAAQRFGLGLEVSSEGYVIGGGFEAQNRHFGRDVGGQLLRDLVG